MKKYLLKSLKITLVLYLILCLMLYFFQEKLIFFPDKLKPDYRFGFLQDFEEIFYKTKDGEKLNALLFKAKNPKGVVFYLHGNGGSLHSWGDIAETYTQLNYDVLLLDYRGFGKSEGKIRSQDQLFTDNQLVYDELKKRYTEDKIIVLGYSIGTGMASYLASNNSPKMLILQAPYYNLTDMMVKNYPFIPTFILRYKFSTNEYLKNCKMPIIIFHGKEDEAIGYDSSLKLKNEFNSKIKLITLLQQGHNNMSYHKDYLSEMQKILE